MPDDSLDRLDACSRDLARLATEVAANAGAFNDDGARNRIALVTQRLKIALDELGGAPDSDITDE